MTRNLEAAVFVMPSALEVRLGGVPCVPTAAWRFVLAFLVLGLNLALLQAAPGGRENPDYLIQNWSAGEGVPENSALTVAQTPDGYLWLGSSGGLLRFNTYEFNRVSRDSGVKELDTTAQCLSVDRTGRFWVSTSTGLSVLEQGRWRLMGGELITARSIAQSPGGEVFAGTFEGRLFRIQNDVVIPVTNAPKLAPSGVFLIADAKEDLLWMANRSFVGRWTPSGWQPVGPQRSLPGSLLAASARGGGLWVYIAGELWRYHADGQAQKWKAPSIDQPRELFEDSSNNIWVASMAIGLVRWRPGEPASYITTTNGLSHGSARSIVQDAEGNLWVGTSSSGLFRLKARQFVNVGSQDGLPDRIVKTITEISPTTMLVGTHGGGTARIENDRMTWRHPAANGPGAYAWSVLRDRIGRVWTGTYHSGLLVEEHGVERAFPLPPELGSSVAALLEDSQGRIWVGASLGLGVIENGVARVWPRDEAFTKVNARLIVEDHSGEALWVGTYGHGLWRVDLKSPGRATRVEGLPRKRITALAMDTAGYLWAGVFGEGLFCIRNGKCIPVGRRQGLPANTIGSLLEDGRGWMWLGSDRGILRASVESLHRVVEGKTKEAQFAVFDSADGMDIRECSEGYQPTAARDSNGRLWFATLRGVVRVDPASLRLNDRPAPIVVEGFSFKDSAGVTHSSLDPGKAKVVVPAGSTGLKFDYVALSYTAPEKVQYSYYLEGAAGHQVEAGKSRFATFQVLPPGDYRLQIKAANNDGLWNERGTTVAFTVQPFIWQTIWFRGLALVGIASGIGLGGWRVARGRYRGQIERLEHQHALARERARLSAVLDATTDLVAFADRHGNLLHLNPAGRHLLGLSEAAGSDGLKLGDLFAPWAALQLRQEAIPGAELRNTWQGESALLRRDGCEIPVSQVVMAHKDPTGQVGFLSTIARDISEQRRAAAERERLQSQLAQAQKIESVGRLAGGVAHDFNNALQVILGHVELALLDTPAGSPLEADLLEIRRSAERSAALTGQLLAFASKQMVCPQTLDLNSTVGGMLEMLERLLGESVRFNWVPGKNLWPVKADPAQVEQLLTNLVVNARDSFDETGAVTVQTRNVVLGGGDEKFSPECPPGDYVSLIVSDNGRGMPPQVLEHLFEPFFTTKGLGKGTGLGLATVFGMVRQNSGSITVESLPNKGTTFRIFLPRAQAPPPGNDT